MRTSTFEVQTHAARGDGQKANRANNHTAALIFFHDSGFRSQVKVLQNHFSTCNAQKLGWDRIVQGWANFSHKGPHCKKFGSRGPH